MRTDARHFRLFAFYLVIVSFIFYATTGIRAWKPNQASDLGRFQIMNLISLATHYLRTLK
jgi:hypothetical protein